MSETPNIDVASSDKSLNQRFRKQKSSLPLLILIGVLGVAVVAVPFLIPKGNNNDNSEEENVAEKKKSPDPKPKLIETNFAAELNAGDVATFELKPSLQNAEPSKCRVEWNALESTLPRKVLETVRVDDQLTVSIQTNAFRDEILKRNKGQTGDWKLIGKIRSGENVTDEFTITLNVKLANSPPVIQVPGTVDFDPVLGANALFSATDAETPASLLIQRVVVDPELQASVRLIESKGNSRIEFRPSRPFEDEFVVGLEVEDSNGSVSRSEISFSPKPQSQISILAGHLKKELDIDLYDSSIKRLGSTVQIAGDVAGETLELVEYLNDGDRKSGIKLENIPKGRSRFRKGSLVVSCSSANDKLKKALVEQLGQPEMPIAPAITASNTSSNAKLLSTADELLKDKKLFDNKSFGQLVFAFVEDFERENSSVLKAKYDELDGLEEFLDDQKGLKAELFLAINPAYDNLANALNVLNEIRKEHPKEIVPYKNLAIAIAVCWDVPNANYSFVGHQRRTNSVLPENLTDAVENFKHFVTYQNQMQGRAQWLPWEFLVHVINHRTPDKEKYWALENYLANRALFGKCYKDVPYDYEMLKTKSQVCKLDGVEYSLPNLRSYGGVCAMQADFASRVGKSLGVPSEYVGGKSANGENHAWVMWVEIRNVTRTGIAFSLESFGRYRGDHYYVGNLKDPKSGQRITDRQLELRLHTVGTNAYAKRHVDLLMRIFPELAKSGDMDMKEQLKFLEQAIKLCPWHEDAWTRVANLIFENEIDRKMHRQMNQILNSMFAHFAAFPDFTWEIFDRLVSFVPKESDRNKYYVKLLNLYVAAKRPDLACEAQLKLTSYLEQQNQVQIAMQGLANTIKTFPDEGRYVPRLLDRLEKLVGDDPEMTKQLIQFHVEFLPLVPQKRGNSASKYCIKMYQRAIQFFTKHGATAYANLYQAKLQELQSTGN